ncbi:MAG TPA: PilZ domain-containing protein [Planctomycetota bacterium]|nr:PilZ domain-containing protein [Planctomycetota bacterium]
MGSLFDSDRREYVRIRSELLMRYKFLGSSISDPNLDKIYEGKATNISGGGIMIKGTIPDQRWIPELLMQRMVIGINFSLPNEEEPVKTLTRVAWIETVDENAHIYIIGLKFKEITTKDTDKIFRFIIRNQLPS